MGKMSELCDLVVGDIKDPEVHIVVQARYLRQKIMRNVKLFEID